MRIYVETYAVRNPYVGVGEFCMNLGHYLAKHAELLRNQYGITLHFIVPRGHKGIFGNQVAYLELPRFCKPFMRLFPWRIDLLHLTHQYCPFNNFLGVKNELLTIHDINFMYEKKGKKLLKYKRRLNTRIKAATHINYISKFTKTDVEKYFDVNKETRVIYNGVKQLVPATEYAHTFLSQLPAQPFLFHISSLRPKKNIHLLIEMMRYLPNETLVIAGNWDGNYGTQLKNRIKELELKNVVCLNNVSNDEKAYLYQQCKAFLFPSACEGFGLPPIEAMHFGKPVFLSNLTSLPEVGGTAAFYWTDLNPEPMANLVRQQLSSVQTLATLEDALKNRATSFDWEKCATEYIKYYLDILGINR